jgi:hypothetical protein
MAKQQIKTYAFTPGTANNGTIEVMGFWPLEQITLITNVTRGIILYNFADASFSGTTATFNRTNSTNFPQATQAADGTTLIYLSKDTSSQSSADHIQIFVERAEQITRPWPLGTDAFERTRMASPQSMLDADFEYGLQPTKWQQLTTVRGAPGTYEIPGTDYSLTSITTDASNLGASTIDSLITVVTTNPHNLSTGTVVTVQNLDVTVTGFARAQGTGIVNSVTNATTFSYYSKAKVGTSVGQSLLVPATIVRRGGFYTNAGQTPTFSVAGSGASTTGTVTLTYTNNHGLVPGDGILVLISSDNGSNNNNLCQGPFYITSVPTPTTVTYNARNTGTITGTPAGTVYARADSFYQHRPIDGGVSLGAGGPNYGSAAVRMSKKYIRYQSGKAINYNTAALFAPNYDLASVTATNTTIGSTITIVNDDLSHGLQAGAVIGIAGLSGTGYNGTYTVATIVDEKTIQVTATSVLSTTTAALSTKPYMYHTNWQGSTVRAGTYDDQNGMFFQYDGQYMAVGLRYSTQQVAGLCTVTPGSTLIIGNSNATYNTQLIAGDRVVIRGMSHVVTAVSSSTWVYVNPPFRGATTSTGVKMSLTIDKLIPQYQWNMDRCDGSAGPFNPSGYNLLPWKVQMIGIQWTWYGAGFIDWMLRGPDGNYITVHRLKNSNVNTEAYMRSGNQPVRYEVQNEGWHTGLVQSIGTTDVAMTVTDVTYFPSSGIVYVDNEMIKYTSKSTSTGQGQLLGLTRTAPLTYYINGALQSFTATNVAAAHTAGTGVVSVGVTATPTISHWGSAFLTDGGFDQDRGYIFSYNAPNITVSTVKKTAFAIRLAPSVSNAITGDLGARDLINRAQLLLQTIENTVGGGSGGQQAVVIEGVINASNYPNTVTNITWFSLQGTVAGGNLVGSGQPSFTQVSPSSYINFDGTATYTTTVSATTATATGSVVMWVASTASMAIGDAVVTSVASTSGGIGIAGNTLIQTVGQGQITLTQPVLTTITTNTGLTFYRNQWAVPGETIFSFISSPANKDSLDLSQLKELTNTPLGGRGTYPNGPDTLFINVYLTSGPSLQTNLVLRWGEAQA